MTKLLVSVKSAAEARIALLNGAALIDVKDPARGSLGRADESVILDVAHLVGQQRPVSAALGELLEDPLPPTIPTLTYAKWGLAGLAKLPQWRQLIAQAKEKLSESIASCRLVLVAYADFRRASSPGPEEIIEVASELSCPAVLIDTWMKDGTNLLDLLTPTKIASLSDACRERGLQVALAGSLGVKEIESLLPARPDWFAVRGAVCDRGRRDSAIDGHAVQRIANLLVGT